MSPRLLEIHPATRRSSAPLSLVYIARSGASAPETHIVDLAATDLIQTYLPLELRPRDLSRVPRRQRNGRASIPCRPSPARHDTANSRGRIFSSRCPTRRTVHPNLQCLCNRRAAESLRSCNSTRTHGTLYCS